MNIKLTSMPLLRIATLVLLALGSVASAENQLTPKNQQLWDQVRAGGQCAVRVLNDRSNLTCGLCCSRGGVVAYQNCLNTCNAALAVSTGSACGKDESCDKCCETYINSAPKLQLRESCLNSCALLKGGS